MSTAMDDQEQSLSNKCKCHRTLLQIDPGPRHLVSVYLNRCSDEGCFSDGTKGYMATLWRITPISLGCVTFPQTETDAQPQLPGERQISPLHYPTVSGMLQMICSWDFTLSTATLICSQHS